MIPVVTSIYAHSGSFIGGDLSGRLSISAKYDNRYFSSAKSGNLI
jgi:hypothetical protein